jgi:hypothetical protein
MELQRYKKWVLVSITSTRELGQHMSNLQAWLLGLNLHNFFVPSLPSPRAYGIQVALGTHTIWGPFMLMMTSLGTQMAWFQPRSSFIFPILCATNLPLAFFLMT